MSQQLYKNIPESDFLNFKGDDGTDYKKVVDFLKLDTNALSKIGGVSKKSIRFDTKIPTDLKERLEQIAIICSLVAEYFKGDPHKTYQWFTIPNPTLGNVSPRDMIRLGRYNKLLKFVVEARNLNEVHPA